LANAIRDEYGPPQGYLAAKHREERQAQLRKAREAVNRRISHKDAIRSKKEARLREMLSQLERERGNAWAAFTVHLAKEREKVVRVCSNLTAERRKSVLDTFDTEARRLELFTWGLEAAEGRRMIARENGKASPGVGPAGRISSCVEP
jgi:hypothetical protein